MKRRAVLPASRTLSLLVALVVFSGCAHYRDLPAGTTKEIGSSVVSRESVFVPITPQEPAPPRDYLVGPGDILLVNVIGRPEFIMPAPGGASKSGSRVDGSGALHLPLAGVVPVAGLTLSQIERKLTGLLKKYLQDPYVVVEIVDYKSQPLYLLGQFKLSGTYYLDRPLTLVQGLALGNGFDPTADLRGARLTRDGKIVPVDLYDLLLHGDARQNVWLKGGDTLYIPDNRNQQVFVFGAVNKPGAVPIPPGGMNLSQAIASADLKDVGYDFKHVRIIRSLSTTRGELIVVDYDRVLRGEALPIKLFEGDIIYVPRSVFGTWNDALTEVLPSLTAIGAILQPFVSIKYMTTPQ
jgi:polysaccharide export outer membrane protein